MVWIEIRGWDLLVAELISSIYEVAELKKNWGWIKSLIILLEEDYSFLITTISAVLISFVSFIWCKWLFFYLILLFACPCLDVDTLCSIAFFIQRSTTTTCSRTCNGSRYGLLGTWAVSTKFNRLSSDCLIAICCLHAEGFLSFMILHSTFI